MPEITGANLTILGKCREKHPTNGPQGPCSAEYQIGVSHMQGMCLNSNTTISLAPRILLISIVDCSILLDYKIFIIFYFGAPLN